MQSSSSASSRILTGSDSQLNDSSDMPSPVLGEVLKKPKKAEGEMVQGGTDRMETYYRYLYVLI